MSNQPRKLYRSQTDRVLAGVCGGVGEYLNIDSTIIRILWVVLTILGGSGIILYIVSIFIIPLNPTVRLGAVPSSTPRTLMTILGLSLVVVGSALILDNLDLLNVRGWWRLMWDYLLPAVLVLAGIYVLARGSGRKSPDANAEAPMGGTPQPEEAAPMQQLRRSVMDRKLFGVCGGLADYFNVDSTVIRLFFVLFTLLSFGFGILAYLLFLIVMPEERLQTKS